MSPTHSASKKKPAKKSTAARKAAPQSQATRTRPAAAPSSPGKARPATRGKSKASSTARRPTQPPHAGSRGGAKGAAKKGVQLSRPAPGAARPAGGTRPAQAGRAAPPAKTAPVKEAPPTKAATPAREPRVAPAKAAAAGTVAGAAAGAAATSGAKEVPKASGRAGARGAGQASRAAAQPAQAPGSAGKKVAQAEVSPVPPVTGPSRTPSHFPPGARPRTRAVPHRVPAQTLEAAAKMEPGRRLVCEFGPLQERWAPRWQKMKLYATPAPTAGHKFYCLDFFPYPSGSGLSVGHLRNYIPTDVITRMMRMRGHAALHPMGWDAFGLPAENYAIQMGVHPAETTARNVANYKRQLALVETCYDWDREINSSSPDYYRWTQWFFLLLHERGLAYQAEGHQWWCDKCATVLANEQVEDGRCWRHTDTEVTKKSLKQWFFKITAYADRLLADLDTIDWPDHIKKMQANWIGRSEGTEVVFRGICPDGGEVDLPIFTTRVDTIFGATYMVIAPEHPLVARLTAPDCVEQVAAYVAETQKLSEIDRASTEKEKSGVALGSLAVNPLSGELIPIWIGDYVIASYGTGIVMGVPAHDTRDFAFAQKFSLPVRQVIIPRDGLERDPASGRYHLPRPLPDKPLEEAYVDLGVMVRSGNFSGLASQEAFHVIGTYVESRSIGHCKVNTKLRDWLISRQRYWGCPIPIVHCAKCGAVPVPKGKLPVTLPEIKEFRPAGTGRSPLATVPEFLNTTCPKCKGPAERETDTMDGFACSSWYFLRFASPRSTRAAFDPEAIRRWLPVDLYVGGAEHAVMHLLYARFWTKVMFDAGLVPFQEPFLRLRNQGMMLAPSKDEGARPQKMSKSAGNVVTPDEVVEKYGADTCRTYILFMGDFEADVVWSDESIAGVHRFLNRVWDHTLRYPPREPAPVELPEHAASNLRGALHRTIRKVTADIEGFRFNTAVAALMEFHNTLTGAVEASPGMVRHAVYEESLRTFLTLLAPMAVFLAEELWDRLGYFASYGSIHAQCWPEHDPAALATSELTYPVQINGKVRDRIVVSADAAEGELRRLVLASPKVKPWLEGKTVKNVIVIPNRLVSVVVE